MVPNSTKLYGVFDIPQLGRLLEIHGSTCCRSRYVHSDRIVHDEVWNKEEARRKNTTSDPVILSNADFAFSQWFQKRKQSKMLSVINI